MMTSIVTCRINVDFFTCCTINVFVPNCCTIRNGPSYLISNLLRLLSVFINTKSLILYVGFVRYRSYRFLYIYTFFSVLLKFFFLHFIHVCGHTSSFGGSTVTGSAISLYSEIYVGHSFFSSLSPFFSPFDISSYRFRLSCYTLDLLFMWYLFMRYLFMWYLLFLSLSHLYIYTFFLWSDQIRAKYIVSSISRLFSLSRSIFCCCNHLDLLK